MKAYHILMFMLLFNLFFWTISVGIGIYQTDITTEPGFSMEEQALNPTGIAFGIMSVTSIFGNAVIDITALTILLASASMLGYFSAGTAPQGVIYGAFSWLFWSSFLKTMTVFYNISNASGTVLYVIIIFAMIVGVIFIVGLSQMVTGGWKGHE